jgi:3-hydroxyisobutyrate dehydrogenase-like beta-hydroxyacid dehydrogenase
MKVGFVGLGHMGSGMAASLLKAGHEVIVYNRTRAKAEPLIARGARVVASVADACRESVVITMLANDDAVEGLVLGKGGVIDSLPKGGIHISSSTISVALSSELAKAHAKAGQRFVAAPVFGRPDVAAAGQLFVITAGSADAIAAATPLFDAIGQKTFVVSETPKAANLVKLSGNFLLAVVIESLGEAMALVGKGGVGRHQYLDILTSTLFSAPVYKTYGASATSRHLSSGRLVEMRMSTNSPSEHRISKIQNTPRDRIPIIAQALSQGIADRQVPRDEKGDRGPGTPVGRDHASYMG